MTEGRGCFYLCCGLLYCDALCQHVADSCQLAANAYQRTVLGTLLNGLTQQRLDTRIALTIWQQTEPLDEIIIHTGREFEIQVLSFHGITHRGGDICPPYRGTNVLPSPLAVIGPVKGIAQVTGCIGELWIDALNALGLWVDLTNFIYHQVSTAARDVDHVNVFPGFPAVSHQ